MTLSLVTFDDLEDLIESGLARTNRVEDGQYVSDFDLVDLQVSAGTRHKRWPIRVGIDTVVNLGADRSDENWGGYVWLAAGTRRQLKQWELGLAFQRIQRDAVLAAFNSDDWWFRTATRGTRGWVTYGLRDDFWIRLSVSSERRDDLGEEIHRVLLDLEFEF